MTSKAEYLKRYMSNESSAKKKKKEKKPAVVNTSRVKILDDDVDFKTLLPQNLKNTLDDDIGDDNPAVAEFIDERPQHVKELERFRQSKQWKVVTQQQDSGVEGRQSDKCSTESGSINPAERSVKDRRGATVSQRRHDSDSDLDVPRHTSGQRHDSDSDLSPARTKDRPDKRHDSDSSSDLSPVRTNSCSGEIRGTDSVRSPKRSGNQSHYRHDSDSDLSPVRASGRADDSLLRQSAGKRTIQRHDSNSDLSPKRARDKSSSNATRIRSGRHDSDSDLSPKRARDQSPSNTTHVKSARHDSDSDLSPPRTKNSSHRQDSDSDLSPVRQDRNADRSLQQPVLGQRRSRSPPSSQKMTKTLSGAKAGLQSAADMRKESQELKRRENTSFSKISDEMLGKNAQTVVRDKATGRRRDLDAERAKQAETDATKAVTTAKYEAWNKGLRQKELQEERISDALHEAEKPLARYSDDADLDARLREQEREGDTMLAYIRKKKEKSSTKSKPVYRGPEPPPNRFGIRPGYRWDGVDRSNGFEKLYFTKLSEKKAIKDMAYKWSVEDM